MEQKESAGREELPLTARVRALYEDSAVPVREIAQIAGVSERTLYKYVTRGKWRRRYASFKAAKGSGGRFISRADAGKPQPSGLKALDPVGAARASACCERAGELAAKAAAAGRAERETAAQLRAFETLSAALIELAKIERERGTAPMSPALASLTERLENAVLRQIGMTLTAF
jgi:AcrR family transcriptional regulator